MKKSKYYILACLVLCTWSVFSQNCPSTKKEKKEKNDVFEWAFELEEKDINLATTLTNDYKEKMLLDTINSFLSWISILPTVSVPFYGTDTNVSNNDTSFFNYDNDILVGFEWKYLKYLSAIPDHFLGEEDTYYCASRVYVIKGMDVEGIPVLFHMAVPIGYNKSRSLIFAIFDSSGKEISSKILVTDDEDLEAYTGQKGLFRMSSFLINSSFIEIEVFTNTEGYEYAKTFEERFIFRISSDGKIRLAP